MSDDPPGEVAKAPPPRPKKKSPRGAEAVRSAYAVVEFGEGVGYRVAAVYPSRAPAVEQARRSMEAYARTRPPGGLLRAAFAAVVDDDMAPLVPYFGVLVGDPPERSVRLFRDEVEARLAAGRAGAEYAGGPIAITRLRKNRAADIPAPPPCS